jgi:hypothetical protein
MSLVAAPKTALVDPQGRQLLPFYQAFMSAAQCKASPFLQDIVHPLQAAAILIAMLSMTNSEMAHGAVIVVSFDPWLLVHVSLCCLLIHLYTLHSFTFLCSFCC